MKILVAEDHALFREALGNLLRKMEPAVEITEASRYSEVFAAVENTRFDLIILDLDLPDKEWDDGLRELKEKAGDGKIVVVSASEDCRSMRRCAEYGIVGYIPKSLDPKILSGALRLILDGGTYIPINAVNCGQNENTPRVQTHASENSHGLTKRQTQVLGLVAEGKSNKQIAYEMGVSEATVKLHINALLRTLGVTNRTQAVITAQKMGLL